MHGLVHPHALGDEPVVDRAQRLHHPTVDAGLLAHLAAGRRLDRLARLHVPLREHPLQRALAGTTSDQDHLRAACAGGRHRPAPGASRTTRPPAEVSASVGSGRRPRRADRPAEGRDTARWYERETPRPVVRAPGGRREPGPGRARRALPLLPVPAPTGPDDAEADQRRLTAAQQRAVAELVRVAPVVSELGRAVRGSRARARAGRRLGPRRAPRPARRRPRLRHRPPAPSRPEPSWTAGPTRSGTPASPSARSAPARGRTVSRSRPTAARRTTRTPASPRCTYGDTLVGDLRAPRLHGQRDGGDAARPDVRRPVRRAGRPGRRSAAHAGHAGGVLLRRPAADDAGGQVPAQLGFSVDPAVRDADHADGRPDRDRLARSGCSSSSSSSSRAPTRSPRCASSSTPGSAEHVLPELPACCGWRSTSTTGTRTCTSTR